MRGSRRKVPTGPNDADLGDDEQFVLKSEDNRKENDRREDQNRVKQRKSSKIEQSLNLPIICNMNPRSVYNKINEFHKFVNEEQVDI